MQFSPASFLEGQLQDDKKVHAICVLLYILGDYFEITWLTMNACELLNTHHVRRAVAFQRMYFCRQLVGAGIADLAAEFYREEFFSQAKIAYAYGSLRFDKLRSCFILFFRLTRFLPLLDDSLHNRLQAVPKFAADVLRQMTTKSCGPMIPRILPDKCFSCKERVLSGRKENLFTTTSIHCGHEGVACGGSGFCVNCDQLWTDAQNFQAMMRGNIF